MKKNDKSIQVYLDQPCERCGSKKKVSKTWKEKVPTFSGSVDVEYSQITCTNPTCQTAFDKNLVDEREKRDAIKLKKEANDLIRKANSLSEASKARKIKAQIKL